MINYLYRCFVLQAIVLKSKENSEILIVGNTHLYFKPEADHIRLLQAYYGLMYLRRCAEEMKEKVFNYLVGGTFDRIGLRNRFYNFNLLCRLICN